MSKVLIPKSSEAEGVLELILIAPKAVNIFNKSIVDLLADGLDERFRITCDKTRIGYLLLEVYDYLNGKNIYEVTSDFKNLNEARFWDFMDEE